MKKRNLALFAGALCFAAALSVVAQSTSPAVDASPRRETIADPPPVDSNPASASMARLPWEWGPFFQGGNGVGDRSSYHFTAAGVRLGKVLTNQHLGGVFRGQFEFAGEIIPWWQAFTPPAGLQPVTVSIPADGVSYTYLVPAGGGTFTGVSITPVIFRWDFKPRRRFVPWFQAAGGVIYTTHKFPPDLLVPHGEPGGTSVWNFCPQGGIGFQYFVRPGRAITVSGNGVHISSASLGDRNPGVNASVMFQIGYTFFTRR
jgi:lipid A 3-O-deacylase